MIQVFVVNAATSAMIFETIRKRYTQGLERNARAGLRICAVTEINPARAKVDNGVVLTDGGIRME